jgi:hypothetical protein
MEKSNETTRVLNGDLYDELSVAIGTLNNDALLALLQRGANPNAVCCPIMEPALLLYASMENNVAAIELLVQYGARIEDVDIHGWTALHFAGYYKHTSVVKRLLELGANLNARSDYGETPLMMAVSSLEIVSLLIAAGVDVKVAGYSGRTALSRAAEYSSSNEVVDCIAKRIQQQDAVLLLDWMIALAPLQLPICELIHVRLCSLVVADIYLELADYSIDFQDTETGVGVTKMGHGYSAVLTAREKMKIIQGIMDWYRSVVKMRSAVVSN